jgi:hypothetical protein
MNERVEQLVTESRMNLLTTQGMEEIVDGTYLVSPKMVETYTRLIVEECIKLLPEDCSSEDGSGRHVAWVIKEHFGV